MAVAARTLQVARAREFVLARLDVGAVHALAGIVALSFLVRTVVGWSRGTPTFFSDEYIYAELARSFVESGRPLIREAAASFPALLQPLVTAPAWLVEDVETSFRIVQTLGALIMSLAAVPVFLLARRVGLGRWIAVGLAALTVAVPDMLYAAWVMAEPLAYPLVLGAVAAGTAALARPRHGTQVAFLVLAGLAAFARVQFVVLPVCFLGALVVMGLRERRLRRALREQSAVIGLLGLLLLGLLLTGPRRLLGYYESVLDLDLASPEMAKWVGVDAMLLVYVSGFVIVPGALLGLGLSIWRPRSRVELSFASLTVFVALALLLEAAAYALGGNRIQERYFFYLVPLVGLAFALYASRGWPHRIAHGLLAGSFVALAARVPLAGFSAGDGKTSSPTLLATTYLERSIGDVGLASLLIAITVALLSLAVVSASLRRRGGTATALGLALGACALASFGAVLFDRAHSSQVRRDVLASPPSWVDRSGLERVALLQGPFSDRGGTTEQLFWNRSINSVLLLPGATPPDAFATERVRIAQDGSLILEDRPLHRPLVVDGFAATTRFRGLRLVAKTPIYKLLRPEGRPRLALYAPGRYFDGWLAPRGSFRVWPGRAGEILAGRLSFRLFLPQGDEPVAVRFRSAGTVRTIVVAPGRRRAVSLPVCSRGPWTAGFSAPLTTIAPGRLLSVRATAPVFEPDGAACPAGRTA